MKTQTDPKVDYAFKHVFGREQSKPALKSLLGAVLQLPEGHGIASLELLSPFNEKDSEQAKLSVVDLKARDESGRQFYVEMQMLATSVFRQRALYYWACLHQGQLLMSDDYPVLRPTIGICFVDTPLFRDLPDYHLTFELRERRHHTLFTDQIALHILELPKFNKGLDELTTLLDRWLYFLRHGEELDAQTVPKPLDVPEVRWAIGDLFMISRTDPERALYEARLKERRDLAAERQAMREECRAEARAEARAEGQAETLRQAIQVLQKSLGQHVTPPEELQPLSLEELERIWAGLSNNCD
ncbi:MAG: Rpn family recombination-promoting nuclease/putative transposase [Pirellulales bacterium]